MAYDLSAALSSYMGDERLQSVHPAYLENFREWDLLSRCYEGGDAIYQAPNTFSFTVSVAVKDMETGNLTRHPKNYVESGFLFRHEREPDERYSRRRRMAVWWNYTKVVVDVRASAAAKAGKAPTLPEKLAYLPTDMDLRGTNLGDWRVEYLAWLDVYGTVYAIVDMPQGEPQPSVAHEEAAGIRPYVQILSPLDLVDWEWDATAKEYRFALVNEHRPMMRPDPGSDAEEEKPACWQKVWYADHWEQFKNGKLVSEGPHPFGRVPIVPLVSKVQLGCPEPIGVKQLRPICDANIRLYNLDSWRTDIHAKQTFSQLVVVGGEDMAKVTPDHDIAAGLATYIAFPGATGVEFVSPDVEQPKELGEAMQEAVAAIRAMAGLSVDEAQGVKAAEAIALEREDLDAHLKQRAAVAESFENEVFGLCAVAVGVSAEDVESTFGRDFTTRNVRGRLDMAITALKDAQLQGLAKARLQQEVFDLVMQDMDEDERKEIHEDIESEAERAAEMAEIEKEAMSLGGGKMPPDDKPEPGGKVTPFGKPGAKEAA